MIILVAIALGLGIVAGLGLHSIAFQEPFRNSYHHKTEQNRAMEMHHSMHQNTNEHEQHQMMVTSEQAFIEHMIPHHQEAIDTAKEVLARGGSTSEIRALAENIITAQEREIADMKQWYETWYGTPYADTGTYKPMMRDLSMLSGAELDKIFLEDMVHHHMGAIMMARSVEPFIEHDEMRTLTEAIVRTQSEEIKTMQTLHTGLQ